MSKTQMQVWSVSTLSLAMCIILVTHAKAQDTSTAEAKEHYQNAVNAIAKSDWNSAKAELTMAATLAPRNALVHYDLGLAYSNTGDKASAVAELQNALQLGLPAAQKETATKLVGQLKTSAGSGSDRPLEPTSIPRPLGPQASSVRALNGLIKNELGATTNSYRPFSFTFETSTGKLWWTRVTNAYCQGGSTFAQAGARLSELDADTVRSETDNDGATELVLGCKNGFSCMDDWVAPTCASINDFSRETTNSAESISKNIKVNHVPTPMRFMGKLAELQIQTTGDPDATAKAIEMLKQLIAKAGPPSKVYIQEGERQQAAAKAQERQEQEEQARADQAAAEKLNDQLSRLAGHWHANYGERTTRRGQVANQFAPGGSNEGNVDAYLEADYDLVMQDPSGGRSVGVYTISNYTATLMKSGSIINYVCFNVGAQCYRNYTSNKTQTYDVVATVSGSSFQVRMTHRRCDGDCSESSQHMPDRSPDARLESAYIMYLDSHKFVKH